jgi:tetratricopeptide (TPR) repeat protein
METNRLRFRQIFAFETCALGLALALCAAGCGERAESQAQPAGAQPQAQAPTPELPDELVKALEATGTSDYDAARDALAKLDRDKLSPAHRALADRIDSQLHSVAGEYAPALESLERALASGAMTPDEVLTARFDKGWLHAQLGQSTQAVEVYRTWQQALKAPAPPTQLLMISEAYAGAHDCAGAAKLIADAYKRIAPEETVDVAATLEVVRPLCPDEPGLAQYGNIANR